jgi:hypothetical protein
MTIRWLTGALCLASWPVVLHTMADPTRKCVCCDRELGPQQIYRHLARLQRQLEQELNGIDIGLSDSSGEDGHGGDEGNGIDAGTGNDVGVGSGDGGDGGNGNEGK